MPPTWVNAALGHCAQLIAPCVPTRTCRYRLPGVVTLRSPHRVPLNWALPRHRLGARATSSGATSGVVAVVVLCHTPLWLFYATTGALEWGTA